MSFCRITGKSRALPKPNYFPLLPPISPADARRFCKITGKAYGLPSHHYIPVLLTTLSDPKKCKITNVSDELGAHHFMPDISYGKRKHIVLTDYRYVFPIFDESNDVQKSFLDILNSKTVTNDTNKFVYKVDERKCTLVFSARLEAAVRDGDIRDVMLVKNCDSVLLKMRLGNNVSVDLQEYDEENDDNELFEGEGPRYEILLERKNEESKRRKIHKSDKAKIFEEKERKAELQQYEDEANLYRQSKLKKLEQKRKKIAEKANESVETDVNKCQQILFLNNSDPCDVVKPVIESWDWNTYENEVTKNTYQTIAQKLPQPLKISPEVIQPKLIQLPQSHLENTSGFDAIPFIGPLNPQIEQPSVEIIKGIGDLTVDKLEPLLDLREKILKDDELLNLLPSAENIPELVKKLKTGKMSTLKNIPGLTLDLEAAKKVFVTGQTIQTAEGKIFIPGQSVNTPDGPVFVPGLTVNTPNGPSFIPGQILESKDKNVGPIFTAGQIINNVFIPGQVFSVAAQPTFVQGQTVMTPDGLKFVPGLMNNSSNRFIPGQELVTPDGIKFMPGQTLTVESINKFMPGQSIKTEDDNWSFVPGQIVGTEGNEQFIPGKTINTDEGSKFVPGQHIDNVFIPGITRETPNGIEFVSGLNVETKQGPKFIEGNLVESKQGIIFMPGKSITNSDGIIEFAVANSINDVVFNDPIPTGYVVDSSTAEVSNQCFSVYGYMIQTHNGVEFYPEKIESKQRPQGKCIPGKLIKQHTDTKFVPGIMENGGFIPGQVVWTDKGEKFIPGQVIETHEGLKFVPGQVIETKTESKFVPGQTIDTKDGPRFVPGQIVQTKAGPTFIPGQVIFTEEKGERFVPGQVVDTEDGPRFVPGRVIENDDKVTFIPGQIVQTSEGPKFVAPDLTNNENGEQEFSVQSFLVSPEELTLLQATHTWNHCSTNGELSIDSKMLRQLSEAGMTIGRQIEASAVDIVLQSTKNIQSVKSIVENFGWESSKSEMLLNFFKDVEKITNGLCVTEQRILSMSEPPRSRIFTTKKLSENEHRNDENILMETFISAIFKIAQESNLRKCEMISNKQDNLYSTNLLEHVISTFEKIFHEIDTNQLNKITKSNDFRNEILAVLQDSVNTFTIENSKLDALKFLTTKINQTEPEITKNILSIIDDEDLQIAFEAISNLEPRIIYKILNKIKENNNSDLTYLDGDLVTKLVKESIIKSVKESTENELKIIFGAKRDENDIHELLSETLALSKAFGNIEMSVVITDVLNGKKPVSHVFDNPEIFELVKRTLIIKKLEECQPSLKGCIEILLKDPYEARKENLVRKIIRQSGVICIMPEDQLQLIDSNDVPISLFCMDNQLAMEDFILRRHPKNRGAFLIVKEGLQAVVPRELSRDVLTGKCAYTVLDENGIRHFEPLHVFSALKLNTLAKGHRFSMYSCDIACSEDDPVQFDSTNEHQINDYFISDENLHNNLFNISTAQQKNTEKLARRRKIRELIKGGKVNRNIQKYRNYLQRIRRQLNI